MGETTQILEGAHSSQMGKQKKTKMGSISISHQTGLVWPGSAQLENKVTSSAPSSLGRDEQTSFFCRRSLGEMGTGGQGKSQTVCDLKVMAAPHPLFK